MNLLDLTEALVVVADTGSILHAAKALAQTSAAVSKKISRLEEHLNTQLFIRGRKGVQLTELGQIFYHEAKKAMEQFKFAENCLNTKTPKGSLKVVANHHYCEKVIIPNLNLFQKQYPEIHLSIEGAEKLPDFSSGKMDLLFGVSAIGDDQLVRKKLTSTRYVLCASRKYLEKRGTPQTPAELLQHDYIAHQMRNPKNRIILDSEEEILMNARFAFDHTPLMIQAALNGLGIIWSHENLLHEYLKKGLLTPVLRKKTTQEIPVFAYYPYTKIRDQKIKAFLDFYSKKIEGGPTSAP
jgi:DNA-binding transcriptional LysR family regulator